ncbi:MAG: hypothetical protein EAZ82_06660 [Verrucomicrobia bacterium]|nr:MAG: hypothetical protein EAZ82_06660 [Verrucomicrobiota bacterium]
MAVLLALIGYIGFIAVADDYTKAASDGVSVVAQKYLKKSEDAGETLSQHEAIQKAKKDVRIGNKVKAAPTSVIQRKAVSMAMVGGGWWICYLDHSILAHDYND